MQADDVPKVSGKMAVPCFRGLASRSSLLTWRFKALVSSLVIATSADALSIFDFGDFHPTQDEIRGVLIYFLRKSIWSNATE